MAKKVDSTNKTATPSLNGAQLTNISQRTGPPPTPVTPRKKTVAPKAPKSAKISQTEIALKAYYIAEARRKMGLPGDEASDWLEAERQLKGGKTPAKKAPVKKAAAKAPRL